MAKQRKRWIIKDSEGRISGPFPTEKVLYKIGRGEIGGEESIAVYPGGDWFPISQEPQFYDRLIEVLAGSGEGDSSTFDEYTPVSEQQPKSKAKTVVFGTEDGLTPTGDLPPGGESPKRGKVRREKAEDDPIQKNKKPADEQKKDRRNKARSGPDSVIELMDMGHLIKKERVKRLKLPIFIAVIVVVVGIMSQMGKKQGGDRIHLTAIQAAATPLTREQLIDRMRRAQQAYTEGTFSSLLKAQNNLLQVVEGDTKNAGMLALLCLTYYELWPYTYQDSKDLKAVSIANQRVSGLDPAGQNSATCRVVDLLVRGRYSEAKSMTETILDTYSATANPPIPFYFFKAVLLSGENELQTAINYLNSAQQLSPRWLTAFMLEADLQSRIGNRVQAAKIYRYVLQVNPQHKIAKLELGLIEFKHFNHLDKGLALLQEALSSSEKVPGPVLSRAYFGMAEISLMRKDNSQALKYAQDSYSQDSTNMEAKNLIVALGGKEKLAKTEVKSQQLVYEGDQYVREGDCNSAQAHYKSAWEMDKQNAMAAMKAARCLWDLSFSREAIEWLNKAIKSDPKLIDAYVTLADYYTQRYDFLAAARILAQAHRVAPKSYEVYRGYALVELRRGNAKAAIGYGQKALGLYETDVETHILLAKANLLLKGDSQAGQQAYRHAAKAVEIDINSRQGQVVYAQALAATKGVELGIDYLLRLVGTYPLVVEYRIALGEMYISDERFPLAIQVFQQVIEIEDKPKKAWFLLGKAQRLLGESQAALESLLKAAILDPADTEPLFEAGLLYLEIKQPVQARTQFQRVLRINNRHPLVHYYMGRAALLMNDPKEALDHAEAERKINPNLADAYLLAAEAYYKMNQHSLCAREYTQAIKLRPQGADTYVSLARCFRLMGNYDMGEKMLDQASKFDSGMPDIYREKGEI
ncbi:MAG: tetratricopeptide repeat protein, partial [Bdellovibrionales bacterium]|nr:tetratricopeptide repeat protein [Bdellovibrionales bacterium]